jgi:hypothetical protein
MWDRDQPGAYDPAVVPHVVSGHLRKSTRVSTRMSTSRLRASQRGDPFAVNLRRQSRQGRRSRGARRVERRTLTARSYADGHSGIGRPAGPAWKRRFLLLALPPAAANVLRRPTGPPHCKCKCRCVYQIWGSNSSQRKTSLVPELMATSGARLVRAVDCDESGHRYDRYGCTDRARRSDSMVQSRTLRMALGSRYRSDCCSDA